MCFASSSAVLCDGLVLVWLLGYQTQLVRGAGCVRLVKLDSDAVLCCVFLGTTLFGSCRTRSSSSPVTQASRNPKSTAGSSMLGYAHGHAVCVMVPSSWDLVTGYDYQAPVSSKPWWRLVGMTGTPADSRAHTTMLLCRALFSL